MMRRYQCPANLHQRSRCGSGAMPVVAAIACFGLVLASLFVVRARVGVQESAGQDSAHRQTESVATSPNNANDLARQVQLVADTNAFNEQPKNNPVSRNALDGNDPKPEQVAGLPAVQTEAAQTVQAKIAAQLAAGEFGPALETAAAVKDANERSRLLKLVADAQMEAGEFEGSLVSIRRIPNPRLRSRARSERAAKLALAGGNGANFGELITLIQNETNGLWEDIDGDGGTIDPFATGVHVDPNGLLHHLTREEQSGRLAALGISARSADLNEDVARGSTLRLVSLTRLEKVIAERIANGQPVIATMKHLAGLSQVRYVFADPESGEIVIGGPAEGWQYNANGLPVGVESGRPTLQLDDLVTVVRTFSHDGLGSFTCLIVPRQAGLKAIKEYVDQSNARGPLRPSKVRNWVRELQKRLGMQDVEINGVPLDSRVARVIVEADYRMKLIGVGKLDGGKGIRSIFDLLPKNQKQLPGKLDALRWWLTMKYDSVLHSPNRDVFEIQGSSVRCRSENEFITDQGQRVHTGKADETNRLFARLFTKHYADLAKRDLVFADLQNIFDLALVAALIRHERLGDRTGWDLGVFAAHDGYRPARFEPPKTVMSVVNHRVYNGKDIVVQVAGGVRADLMSVVKNKKIYRETSRLARVAARGRAPQLPEGRWWWDAAK